MTTKFKPGRSGNPAGRPKGTKDRRTELRALIKPHAPDLIAKALALANEGDVAALKLLLERAVPPYRPIGEAVTFPMPKQGSLADSGRAVMEAIADGNLPPDMGRQLIDALAALGRIVELDELDKRLSALEEKSR